MLARLRHAAARERICVHDANRQTDPTGTLSIRRRYRGKLDIRWRRLTGALKTVIVKANVLGLDTRGSGSIQPFGTSGMDSAAKLRAFQTWVDDTLARVVLDGEAGYLRGMISMAYTRAIGRATRLKGESAIPISVAQKSDQKINAIQELVRMELQGINEAVSQQLVRAAAEALLSNRKPARVYRDMSAIVGKIGKTRGRAMIALLTVRAFGEGTLDTFAALGVKKVGTIPEYRPRIVTDHSFTDATRRKGAGSRISRTEAPSASTVRRIRKQAKEQEKRSGLVEVLTAGDDDVCPICEDISDNGPYNIDTARSLIPAHPNCRCAFVPADDFRFSEVREDDD